MKPSKSILAAAFIAGLIGTAPADAPESDPAELVERLAIEENTAVARRAAAEALGELASGATGAVPALVAALEGDPDDLVRSNAAWALGKIKEPAEVTVPALVASLESEGQWAVRHNAMLSLSWIGRPAIPGLKQLVGGADVLNRANAANALLRVDPTLAPEMSPVLLELLEHENPLVREAVIPTCALLGESVSDTVPVLIARLEDESVDVRRKAVEVLEVIGEPAATPAVPALIDVLQSDSERWNRIAAALALGVLGKEDPKAVEALVTAFNDKKQRVRAYAAAGLGRIGEPAVPSLMVSLGSDDLRTRRLALEALGTIGRPAEPAAGLIASCLNDPDERNRVMAATALGSIGVDTPEIRGALEQARESKPESAAFRAYIDQALRNLDAAQADGQEGEKT